MWEYLKYFFNPRHIFSIRPEAMQPRAVQTLLLIFGLLIAASIVSRVLARGKDKLNAKGYQRLAQLFLTIGIVGYVYVFFAWQGAALLGSRFWLLILAAVTIAWLVFIIKYLIKEAPQRRQEIERKRQIEKYIP